jgi:site-specific DNA-methyltransferase (adenine-specific)
MMLDLEMPVHRPEVVTRQGDARELVRHWSDARRVQIILTDPAYPTLDRHREAGGSTVRLQDWFETLNHREILNVLALAARRLPAGGFCLVMSDWASAYELARADDVSFADLSGSDAPVGAVTQLRWRTPWIWEKTRGDGQPALGMGYYGRGAYEMVLVLQRPGDVAADAATELRRTPNVVRAQPVRGGYPTEKPVELAVQLLSAFCPWGQWLLDPFAGSGWAGQAAVQRGMSAELWDVSPAAPVHTRGWPAGVGVDTEERETLGRE